MVVRLGVRRTQWAVGNGFFHTGRVATDTHQVNYAYDCGALFFTANQAAMRREVAECIDRTPHLDFMFVSHFDYDHVSGLPELARGTRIDRFFIPMVPALERLTILARNLATAPDDAPGEFDFYEDFIIDPVGALSALTAEQNERAAVVVVAPGTETPLKGGLDDAPDALTRAEVAGAQTDEALTIDVEPGRVTLTAQGNVVWEWTMFVSQNAMAAAPAFVNALVQRGLITGEKDLASDACVRNLVRNHKDELTDAYDEAVLTIGRSFNKNLTSLMLYSGPPPGCRFRVYRSRAHPLERPEIGAWGAKPGWLGLGDANLRSRRRVDEVNDAFRTRKPIVGTFAPSHHGARADWRPTLLTGFDPDPTRLPTHVFGASGQYGHPHSKVLRAINEAGATAVTVGLAQASRWTESLRVFVGQ